MCVEQTACIGKSVCNHIIEKYKNRFLPRDIFVHFMTTTTILNCAFPSYNSNITK